MNAVVCLQRLYDDLISCDTSKVGKDSGLTVVDTAEGKSMWSLWDLISKADDDLPTMKPVNGLYMFGERPHVDRPSAST